MAGLWTTLADVAVAAMLLAAAVDAWAPPQDLPWKPLRLADPPGLATRMKLAGAAGDPAACRAVLRDGGVDVVEAPLRRDGHCTTENSLRIRGGTTPLSPAAPTMTCPQVLAYAFWDRHALSPAAQQILGERVVRVEHYGSYACRNVYYRAQAPLSQHGRANAIDVAGFRLADGRTLTVARQFRARTPDGDFVRAARLGACGYFRGVLGPDYNAAHADHFHLESGSLRFCR